VELANTKGSDSNGHEEARGNFFRFHNHLLTNGGSDLRAEKKRGKIYRAVVPNSPLLSRRLYDWPPNPSLSRVDSHEAEVFDCFQL
jgi:hypothetical protein